MLITIEESTEATGDEPGISLFHTKMAKSSFTKKNYKFSSFWIRAAHTSWYPWNQVSETVHNSQSKTKQVKPSDTWQDAEDKPLFFRGLGTWYKSDYEPVLKSILLQTW